jgi:hypothetical protein
VAKTAALADELLDARPEEQLKTREREIEISNENKQIRAR